jgi:cytochrome oxidase Cu insertion factor (SCO1/SenC/PrrC family)
MKLTSLIFLWLLAGNHLFSQATYDTTLVKTGIDTLFKVKTQRGTDTLVNLAERHEFPRSIIDTFVAMYQRLTGLNAPDFCLEDQAGKKVYLHDFAGKVVMLDFWFTACQPCLSNMRYAKPVHDFYKNDTSIVFINVCIDDEDKRDQWKKLIKKHAIPGIHLFMNNEDTSTNNAYYYKEAAPSYPTQVIVSKNGKFLGTSPHYSERGIVYAISNAANNISTSTSFLQNFYYDRNYIKFSQDNYFKIQEFYSKMRAIQDKK